MTKQTKSTPQGELNGLHQLVAKVMKQQLEHYADQPETIIEKTFDEDTGETVEEEVENLHEPVPPALLNAAIKFLDNNDISADIGDNEDLKALRERVKSEHNKGSNVVSMNKKRPTHLPSPTDERLIEDAN